jgi:thiol-disulfide isomerase/thioredoxin
MNFDLSDIRKKTVTASQYIEGLEQPFKEKFLAKKRTYKLRPETANALKDFAGKFVIVVFSAAWCKDCAEIVPVLSLMERAAGLEVRVFGGLKKDPLSHVCKWRIPPSPPEVLTFQVNKIPLVVMVDSRGAELGRIVESPKRWPTLEQEIYEIIKSC